MPFYNQQEQGGSVSVFDDGILVSGSASSFDFVGAGVSATAIGNEVTVNIPGGGSGSFTVVAVSGTIDDSNVDFTALSEPTLLVVNGQTYQKTGGNVTWSYAGGNITLSVPVGTGGSIYGLA